MPFTKANYEQALHHFQTCDLIIYDLMLKYGYVEPPPSRQLFANLVGNIIGQRISFRQARLQRGKLFTRLGTHDFTLDQLCQEAHKTNQGLNFLKDLGIDGLRLEAIQGLVEYLKTNNKILDHPDHLNDLLMIRGIGPWSINCTKIMHSLYTDDQSFQDLVLTQDLIIARGLKDLGLMGKSWDHWKPWKGIVTWYIWKAYTKVA